jgi:intraflagellar transport protein 74
MQNAQVTMQKLQTEVLQRRREFDQKIEDKITMSKRKMLEMEDEMPKFGNVEAIREEGEARKKAKTKEREQLKNQLLHLRKAIKTLATNFKAVKGNLRSNEIETKLALFEKEIKMQATKTTQYRKAWKRIGVEQILQLSKDKL